MSEWRVISSRSDEVLLTVKVDGNIIITAELHNLDADLAKHVAYDLVKALTKETYSETLGEVFTYDLQVSENVSNKFYKEA